MLQWLPMSFLKTIRLLLTHCSVAVAFFTSVYQCLERPVQSAPACSCMHVSGYSITHMLQSRMFCFL